MRNGTTPSALDATWQMFQWEGKVRYFAKSPEGVTGGLLASPARLAVAIANLDSLGYNTYLSLNPTKGGGIKAAVRHVTHWRAFPIDLDPVDPQVLPVEALDQALAVADKLVPGVSASAVRVFTGRGTQAWVFLNRPLAIEDGDHAEKIERTMGGFLHRLKREWAGYLGYEIDTSVSDLPRVVRCPGSLNVKTGLRAHILSRETAGLDPSLLAPFEYAAPPEPTVVALPKNLNLFALYPHLTGLAIEFLADGIDAGGRHKAAHATAKSLEEIGVDYARALSLVMRGALRCRPPLSRRDVERTVRDVYKGRKH